MKRSLRAMASAFALAGGALMLAVSLLTCASVIGRWLAAAPVPGDIELVQIGTAVALALFLPYCQLHGSHLIVDLFTARAPRTMRSVLNTAARWITALVFALLAWRAGAGVAALASVGETSMVLGIPLWVPYAAAVPSLALAAVVAASIAPDPLQPSAR